MLLELVASWLENIAQKEALSGIWRTFLTPQLIINWVSHWLEMLTQFNVVSMISWQFLVFLLDSTAWKSYLIFCSPASLTLWWYLNTYRKVRRGGEVKEELEKKVTKSRYSRGFRQRWVAQNISTEVRSYHSSSK